MSNTNIEFVQNIKLIADEKHIPRDTVGDAIKDAIIKAYVKEYPETEIEVKIDIDNSVLEVNKLMKVVEPYDDLNDYCEITTDQAKTLDPNLKVGDVYRESIELAKLPRTVVVHILQVFKQNIATKSNIQIFNE
jgi:N utilization substance protein A